MTVRSRIAARLGGALARVAARLRDIGPDTRGAIAVWVGLSLLPLSILVFGLVDVSRLSLERRRLQDALDASTLIAARSTAANNTALTTIGSAALNAEMGMTGITSTFTGAGETRVVGKASVTITPIILNLVFKGPMTVSATSEVVRSAHNLEVAVVLDITGSMAGTRLSDLKTAAADLVDIVVQDVQTPYYSKAAIIPYSIGVNVGTYADNVRGAILTSTLASAAWNTGTTKTVSSFTAGTSPTVTTSAAHGFSVGDYILIANSTTSMSNKILKVTSVTSTTKFVGSNTSGTSITAGSGGTAYKCLNATCTIILTSKLAHNFQVGDQLAIASVTGLTGINSATNSTYPTISAVSGLTMTTSLLGKDYLSTTAGANGSISCRSTSRSDISCAYLNFTSAGSTAESFAISNCATERTGTYAYTDDAPSTAYVGRNYPALKTYGASSDNPCPTTTITPLTTDRTALKSQITSLAAGGSTAGQTGLAWGWYMISPNYAYLWPNNSQKPAAYGAEDLMKVVVMMTDGAFNTNYCKGVIASNAGSGSGSSTDHINCTATNGDAFDQAKALCTKMKAKNIIIYTVGFDVGTDASAKSVLTSCATSSTYAYFPSTGSELKTAFKAIAQEISSLRIAK